MLLAQMRKIFLQQYLPFPEVAGSFSSIIPSLRVGNLSSATQGWHAVVARSEMPDLASDYFQGAPYPATMLFCNADLNTCLAGPQCSAESQGRIAP
jgi:hypothetical protein